MEKYSKNDGGSIKITLFAYSQRGRKNKPQTSHFGEVLGAKILPKSRKCRSEIYIKNLLNFNLNLYRLLAHFKLPGRPQNLFFSSFRALDVAPAPTWRQEGPQSAPRQPQRSISKNLGPSWDVLGEEFLTRFS